MLLLSLPLPTMAFPTCSKYFPPLYAVFLHFPMFLLSSCIFPCFYSRFHCLSSHFLRFHRILCHFCLLHFSLHFLRFILFSCIFPCFYSHFLSVPSYFLHFHNIFYDFSDIILQYSATNIAALAIFLHFSLHFPMLFLSFPLPTITFSACSRYFLAIPSHFPAFSRYFLAILLHSPKLLPPLLFSCIFPCFSPRFLHISCIFTVLSRYFPAFSQVVSSV